MPDGMRVESDERLAERVAVLLKERAYHIDRINELMDSLEKQEFVIRTHSKMISNLNSELDKERSRSRSAESELLKMKRSIQKKQSMQKKPHRTAEKQLQSAASSMDAWML